MTKKPKAFTEKKKVPKGEEKGGGAAEATKKSFVPPWMKDKKKK